jgi:hypothetical protein
VRAAATGFNAAAIGAIGAAVISLGRVGLAGPLRLAVALAAAVALWRRVPVWAVLIAAVAVGVAGSLIG